MMSPAEVAIVGNDDNANPDPEWPASRLSDVSDELKIAFSLPPAQFSP
jgi:hypothetical protein